jgi:hypothetical protein
VMPSVPLTPALTPQIFPYRACEFNNQCSRGVCNETSLYETQCVCDAGWFGMPSPNGPNDFEFISAAICH